MQPVRGPRLLLAALAVGYALFLLWYHAPYAGGSDSSGYMNSARLLLQGRLSVPVRFPPGLTPEVLPVDQLVPLGFRLDPAKHLMVPSYPIGLPLHYAAAGLIVGLEHATTLVSLCAAFGLGALLYLTAREFGVRPDWSVMVALAGALSPLTVFYALQPMSDLVAAVWALAVVYSALRSSRHAGWAAGAGAALAVAVLVRPTNLLLVLPAAIALSPRLKTWGAFLLGGAPGALFLAGYNRALYGSVLATGYTDVGLLFSWHNLLPTLRQYCIWVPVVATPWVIAAFALPWLKVGLRKKLLLLVWSGSLFLFYGFYECTQETWWYLRFVLPALPAAGIAAALGLQEIRFPVWFLASRLRPVGAAPELDAGRWIMRLPVTHLMLAATLLWVFMWNRSLRTRFIETEERVYPEIGRWVAASLPAHAVLAAYQASGSIFFYSDKPFINPNNLAPEAYARFNAWAARQHLVPYAVVFPFEEEEFLHRRMPGDWEPVTRIRQAAIWRRRDSVMPPVIPFSGQRH